MLDLCFWSQGPQQAVRSTKFLLTSYRVLVDLQISSVLTTSQAMTGFFGINKQRMDSYYIWDISLAKIQIQSLSSRTKSI